MLQSVGRPIDRYSFETVETLKDQVQIMTWLREPAVARPRLTGMTHAQASLPKLALPVLDVSFDAIADPEERAYFLNCTPPLYSPPRTSIACASSPRNCCASRPRTNRWSASLAVRLHNSPGRIKR